MSDITIAALLFLVPAWLACALAWVWSKHSASEKLARVLRLSALVWVVLLTISFVLGGLPLPLCSGNWLYGYYDCAALSSGPAGAMTTFAVLTYLLGMAYGTGLCLAGGVVETVARKYRR